MREDPPADRWVSATELAEHAYCPRAHWYSRHPEAAPASSAGAVEGFRRGRHLHRSFEARHRAELGASTAPYVGLALGAAAALGAWLWWTSH